jgi:K+-sensing histidine kinase KdpD
MTQDLTPGPSKVPVKPRALAFPGLGKKGERIKSYLWGAFVIAGLTLPGFFLRQALDTSTIAMFYLLGVVGIAFWWGRGPAVAASFLSALALDYFITVPYFSFAISNPRAWIPLLVMLVESLLISALAAKSREGEFHRVAAEAEKTRNAFLSAVSHDLRTPLTGIQGAASSLMGDRGNLSPQERSQLSGMIYHESERLNRLVQNLLDMTRLQAGQPQLKKEWQSMDELVGVAVDRLKGRLADRPFALDLQPGLPLVLVDGLLVEQLLSNLLENALNHTPEGSPLQLGVKESGGTMELEMLDRGPGIKPGEEKAIFEKFIRGYHGGKGGAGLGLSICKAIVQAHGGTIEVENRKKGGACFRVRLPTGGPPPAVQED